MSKGKPVPIDVSPERLRQVADKLGVSFTTVSKVAEAKTKNWRDCIVREDRLRDKIKKELGIK